MTPLEAEIRARIARDGPISVETYMDLCLNHPEHGYYRNRDPLGAAGDFITAPEVSQMFGEIVGAWLVTMHIALGSRRGIRLVELGPGRGTLIADILRVFSLRPDPEKAVSVHLVETNRALRDAQKQTLAKWPGAISWHDTIDDVPDGPMLLVANEFFDALPVRQFVRRGDGFVERVIAVDDDDAFTFADGACVLEGVPAGADDPGDDGTIIEHGAAAGTIMAAIANRLVESPGAALVIDYGYDRPAPGDTLQALRTHRHVSPLDSPGEADLTTHVCFGALGDIASSAGAVAYGPISQAAFLSQLGIGQRAEQLKQSAPHAEAIRIDTDLARLVSPEQMGALFKVLAVTSPDLPAPPPFTTRRADR